MLAILPFCVPVTQLFKPPGSKPGCNGKFSQPPLDRNMHSVGSGISHHKANGCFWSATAAERHPHSGKVGKIRSNHYIVLFLASVQCLLLP